MPIPAKTDEVKKNADTSNDVRIIFFMFFLLFLKLLFLDLHLNSDYQSLNLKEILPLKSILIESIDKLSPDNNFICIP
jgi:hypothetical protein